MSRHVNDGPAASRQFVAQPPFWGSKVASKTTPAWQNNLGKSYAIMVVGILAFCAVLGGLFLGMQSLADGRAEWMQEFAGRRFQLVGLVALFGGVYGWYWWSRRRKIVLSVTSDGLTVNTRPGDVYSFTDTKLAHGGDRRRDDGYGPAPAIWPSPIHSRRTRPPRLRRDTTRCAGRGVRPVDRRRRLGVGSRLRGNTHHGQLPQWAGYSTARTGRACSLLALCQSASY